MINYIEYLGLPGAIGITLIAIFLVMQFVGEFLEFKGKVVPEFLKVRKLISRRKKEKHEITQTLKKVETILSEVNSHYSSDNITKRNAWMESVNNQFADIYRQQGEFKKMMDENNANTLSLLVDSKRSEIIDFASRVVNSNYTVTREQYKRIFKLYKEYEDLIAKHGLTNGEVDIVYRIITESYEDRLKNNNFVEDIRGYKQ